MLADAIVVVHLSIVLLVVTMVPLVYLGAAWHWAWVRSLRCDFSISLPLP
jgi:hypothetical protein